MDKVIAQIRRMTPSVPPFSALRPGVPVNIVLKQHQRTGQLTAGHVAQVLTSGDHPRGVKVRLTDGQVGRVQALNSGLPTKYPDNTEGKTGLSHSEERAFEQSVGQQFQAETRRAHFAGRGSSGAKMVRGLQEDVRNDPQPTEEASLFDFATVKSKKKGKGKKRAPEANEDKERTSEDHMVPQQNEVEELQKLMEKEFPKLDAGLIAAVVSDGPQEERVREVLRAVSS